MKLDIGEFQTSLKCPKCDHYLVADVDIESWVTTKAYTIIEEAIKSKLNKEE